MGFTEILTIVFVVLKVEQYTIFNPSVNEVLLNLLTGRPLKKAQDSINDRFRTGASNARRLMRTESCYVCNQLHLKGYEACGVEKYIYLAILDLKTSQVCRSLDKKRFPVSEAQAGKNFPPMHPYCRSTTIADIPDELLKKLKQSAVDPATGERITVPGDMTYKEWYEKYVEGKDGVLAKQKATKNTSYDKEQYKKYREILGDEMPDTLEKFRDLKYNNTSEWEYLKGLKKYITKYPESNKNYYDIQQELKQSGIKIGVPLPPKSRQAFILPEGRRDAYHIMHRMLERNITDDMVRGYMRDAKCMFVQWNGQRRAYYGNDGVSVITKAGDEWVYKTTWSKNDFDAGTEQIMEVINKHAK